MKTHGHDGSDREMDRLIAQARAQRAMALAQMISDGITFVSKRVAGLWKKPGPRIGKRTLAPR